MVTNEQTQKLQSIVDYLNNEKLRFSKLRKFKVETGSQEPELSQYGLGAESVVNELLEILNK
jgi:hypothetical protein